MCIWERAREWDINTGTHKSYQKNASSKRKKDKKKVKKTENTYIVLEFVLCSVVVVVVVVVLIHRFVICFIANVFNNKINHIFFNYLF